MKVFDENGNFLGEFFEAEKEKIDNQFDDGSWILGIILLLFLFPVKTIIVLVSIFFFYIIASIIKFVLKVIWWIIRLPFCLIFYREIPSFNKSDWY